MSPDDLLDTPGAAEYLVVPEDTLKIWRHRQKGPAYSKIGRHVRYRRSDLDAFVAAGRVEPGSPARQEEDRYAKLRGPRRRG